MKTRLSTKAGFGIVEAIIAIVIVAIIAAVVLPQFVDMTNEASAAVVEKIKGEINSQANTFHAAWAAQSGESGNVWLFVNGIEFQFQDGYPFQTRNSAHVPATIPSSLKNRESTRIWYAFLSSDDLIVSGTGTGWNPLSNGECPGNNRVLCWNYEIDGVAFQQVRYDANNGTVGIFPP